MNTCQQQAGAIKLTPHQRRIVAALAALAQAHDWPWWSRDDIGRIVAAGGYHSTIQLRSMIALKRLGLVQTELSSWPAAIRTMIGCGCARFQWGLTPEGRALASSIKVLVSAEIRNQIARAFPISPAWQSPVDEGEEEWRKR